VIYGFAPHHYDTPGTFDKNLLVCHSILDHWTQYLQFKSQAGTTNCSAYAKTSEKLHASKVKHTQLSNQNAEKSLAIVTFNVHIFNQSTAKITLYSTRHEQQL